MIRKIIKFFKKKNYEDIPELEYLEYEDPYIQELNKINNEEIDNENDAKEASDNAIRCFYNDPKWLINTFESRIDSQIMEEST